MLVDSDVAIDVALNREPYASSSTRFFVRIEGGGEEAAIAWHSIANLHYVVRRHRDDTVARTFVARVLRSLIVSPTSTNDLEYALSLPMQDFEDAMQVAAARACGATFIVTRNLRDYARSPIPAMDPDEALRVLL